MLARQPQKAVEFAAPPRTNRFMRHGYTDCDRLLQVTFTAAGTALAGCIP